ncbi:MAG: hypothetical protein ABIP28_03395 [Mucilaginibacter sp.]
MQKKKAFKVILPVLAGLLLLTFANVIVESFLNHPTFEDDSEGTMVLQEIFPYVILPFITIVLFFIQWWIILPLWNTAVSKFSNVLLSSFSIAAPCCFIIGGGLGFIFWRKQFGFEDLVWSVSIMVLILLVYSAGNIIALYFLDMPRASRSISIKR